MQNRKNYPANWVDEIRPSILKRDKMRCRHCGVKHRSWIVRLAPGLYQTIDKDEISDFSNNGKRPYQVFLQVAHLDNNTLNNDESNLLALCNACHLIMDARWKVYKRLSASRSSRGLQGLP